MSGVSDSYNRPINYLRISVTDRCNLRCVYCSPPGMTLFPPADLLSWEEIARVARVAASLGVNKVRLTGGEPLVRAGLTELVRTLALIEGIDDISLTTNGMLLAQYARELRDAGLRRVNVSLDSLDPSRFERITRGGSLETVLRGIEKAHTVGLSPVKLNVVAMGGVNDAEIPVFAARTVSDGWHVRFIELMPFVPDAVPAGKFMSIAEVRERIETLAKLEPCSSITGNGPARYFRLPGAKGTIGFISPISQHFCFSCNRLRLTADGKLRACLLNNEETDLRPALREGAGDDAVRERLCSAISTKPKQHHLESRLVLTRPMTKLGG